MPPMTGRVIAGRYNLVEPIGRGAMGVVWRARDSLLDRDVAIKEVVLNGAIGDEERENAYRRTMREARTAARLSHRGVVTVYDVAEEDGRPWIIMELVHSRSLDQVLASDGPLPPRRACVVGQQLLAALAAAHAAGVLHRDVKPSNVLIANDPDGDRAVLTDFGIAQFAGDPRLTQTGMVMGSPGFTAPERIRGGHATPASDLWSLGATLYAAVQGRGPYEERGGAITTMSAIINEDAPRASSAGPLGPLIAALLRRDPRTRPSAAAATRMFAGVLPLLPALPPPVRRTPTLVSTGLPRRVTPDATAQDAMPKPGARADAPPAGTAADSPAAPPAPEAAASAAPEDAPSAAAAEAGASEAGAGAGGAAEAAAAVNAATEADAAEGGDADAAAAEDADAAPGVSDDASAAASQSTASDDAASQDAASDDAVPENAVAEDVASENGASEDVASAGTASAGTASGNDAADKPSADDRPGGERTADIEASDEKPSDEDTTDDKPADERPSDEKPADELLPVEAAGADRAVGNRADTGQPDTSPPDTSQPDTSQPDNHRPDGRPDTGQADPSQPDNHRPDGRPDTGQADPSQPDNHRSDGRPDTGQADASQADDQRPDDAGAGRGAPAPQSGVRPGGAPEYDTLLTDGPVFSYDMAAAMRAPAPNGEAWHPGPGQQGYAGETVWPVRDNRFEPPTKPQPPFGPPPRPASRPRRRRGRRVAVAAVAVLLAAAIGVSVALLTRHKPGAPAARTRGTTATSSDPPDSVKAVDNPLATLPAGWSPATVQPSEFGTAGGFSIGVPPGWTTRQRSLSTYLDAPDGARYLDVDLTKHDRTNMVAEAEYVEGQAVAQGHLPGYHRVSLRQVSIRGTAGAFWAFTWVTPGGVTMRVDDLLFELPTPAGPQSYALDLSSPAATFGTADGLPLFDKILRTFQPLES